MSREKAVMHQDNDTHPLKWPDGWERTRIQDRKHHAGWRKSFRDYRVALAAELRRMGVSDFIVSYNLQPSDRIDPGLAVYFSKTVKEDYSWQEALGLDTPAPTLEQIDAAYRRKALQHHPDREGGNPELFVMYTRHREQAKAWVLGTQRAEHEYVIACDRFTECRLNLAAIRLALAALRQLERVGVSSILERSFKGFRIALPAGEGKGNVTAAS